MTAAPFRLRVQRAVQLSGLVEARAAAVPAERAAVCSVALSWMRTPFHHAARVKGAGVDCCQLLVAVYCDETALVPAPAISEYAHDWFLHTDEQRVLAHITRACVRVEVPEPGDIGVFRFGRAIAHAGILLEARPEPDGPLLLTRGSRSVR